MPNDFLSMCHTLSVMHDACRSTLQDTLGVFFCLFHVVSKKHMIG